MQRSIHAMRLSSVMGVPVRGPGGVLAALYLDHRTKRGAFDEAEMDLVLALADHVATALSSARLHAAQRARKQKHRDRPKESVSKHPVTRLGVSRGACARAIEPV